MNHSLLSLGSNSGDRERHIHDALDAIRRHAAITRASHIYETPSCNGVGPDYMNMVIEVESELDAPRLAAIAKEIERELGRDSSKKHNPVVEIDIDVVTMNGEILRKIDFKREYFVIGYENLTAMSISELSQTAKKI